MSLLKDMIENLINENVDNAKVDFHSYLNEKLKAKKDEFEAEEECESNKEAE